MENLELLRHITIGQYLPTGSPIHRLDPRVKLLCFGALVLAVAFNGSYLGNLVMLATVLGLVALARVPLAYALQGIRPALPIILVLAAFQILLPPPAFSTASGCTVLVSWSFLQLTDCTLRLVVVSALRFGELIILTSLLTLCTPIADLSRGIERLLAPLDRLRFPAYEIALVLTIALRFVALRADPGRGDGADCEGPGFPWGQLWRTEPPALHPADTTTPAPAGASLPDQPAPR